MSEESNEHIERLQRLREAYVASRRKWVAERLLKARSGGVKPMEGQFLDQYRTAIEAIDFAIEDEQRLEPRQPSIVAMVG